MYIPCVPKKRPPFYFLITLCTLNPEKIWHEYLTDLSTSPVIWSHSLYLGKSKSHFSTSLFIYFKLFTLPQTKTNSNCCTPALAVCLLFSASYYLHNPSTASGTRYRRSACIDMDMLRLAAVVCCNVGWISAQRGVLCDWSVSKKQQTEWYICNEVTHHSLNACYTTLSFIITYFRLLPVFCYSYFTR